MIAHLWDRNTQGTRIQYSLDLRILFRITFVLTLAFVYLNNGFQSQLFLFGGCRFFWSLIWCLFHHFAGLIFLSKAKRILTWTRTSARLGPLDQITFYTRGVPCFPYSPSLRGVPFPKHLMSELTCNMQKMPKTHFEKIEFSGVTYLKLILVPTYFSGC